MSRPRLLLSVSASCVLSFSLAATAQISPFNEAGVAAGHEHLVTANAAGNAAFWTAIGGVQQPMAPGGTTQVIKFSGIILMAQNARGGGRPQGGAAAATPAPTPAPTPAAPTPPASSVGSSVEHLSFKVKNLRETLGRLSAIGIQPMPGATPTRAFVMSPDNLKVGLTEDASLSTATASDELLMKVSSVADASAWYAKWFGARIVKRGSDTVAEIPGVNIRFAETAEAVAPTQGRALDHIGFEVRNLEAFMTKLAAGGVTVTTPYRALTTLPPLTSLAFIVDPWGTRIELNEGFKDVK